jgi:hypothetical protein
LNYAYDRGLVIHVYEKGEIYRGFSKHGNEPFSKWMNLFSEKSQQTYVEMIQEGVLK